MSSETWRICTPSTKFEAFDEENIDKATLYYRMFKHTGAPDNEVVVIKRNGDIVWRKEDGLPALQNLLGVWPIPVSIPTPLRPLTDNLDTVEVDGASIAELLTALDKKYAGIGERLLDAQGNVRRFVNVYVNGEDIRFLQDKDTPVKQGDEVSIVPAIAGG